MTSRGIHNTIAALALAFIPALCGGCGGREGGGVSTGAGESGDGSAVLARVGSSKLTIDEVRKNMPGGITPDDSVKFVKGYVYSWVDTRLVLEMAPADLDMAEIDRLVAEYREALISEAYRRKMAEDGANPAFSEDSLKSYYEQHKADFKLRTPLVKGVYVKLPSAAANIGSVRKLMRSDKAEDIDRLEKEVIRSNAIHYDYFRERWVDWDQIDVRIPYDFGSPESFLRPGRFLETSADGHSYFLRISEVLPASSVMPFEAAREDVRERLLAERRRQIDATFRADLLRRATETGRAEIFI